MVCVVSFLGYLAGRSFAVDDVREVYRGWESGPVDVSSGTATALAENSVNFSGRYKLWVLNKSGVDIGIATWAATSAYYDNLWLIHSTATANGWPIVELNLPSGTTAYGLAPGNATSGTRRVQVMEFK